MTDFVEVPNAKLGNFAPCPYARAARVNNQIEILECQVHDFIKTVLNSLSLLEDKEVVVICFDHNDIDPVILQEWVIESNRALMKNNYVILEDHPNSPEYVNGVKMNFGECGLLILQKLDKLNSAADKLQEQGYYNSWDKFSLDSVVSWRYIQDEVR
jgi:hypothetical protein